MRPDPISLLRFGVPLLAVGLLSLAVVIAIPPSVVTIETGPVNGSYYEAALKYRDIMRRHGIDLELLSRPDSAEIVKDVDRAGSGVDIGFTASALNPGRFPDVLAAGAIELQPLFIFYNAGLGQIAAIRSLRGKHIVLPAQQSASSVTALQVLSLYGITPANTRIGFMPLADAAHELEAGEADAGFFMLAPGNALVAELFHSDILRALGISDGKGITRHLPFLRTVSLPHCAVDIDGNVPKDDLDLLAATVHVVVRRDINPAVLYMLLEAMKEVHHGATLISDAGDFPTIARTEDLPHPLAVDYAKSGLPWTYRHMPLALASLFDRYVVFVLTWYIFTEIYKNVRFLSELCTLVVENFCLRLLTHIERTAERGLPVSGHRLVVLNVIERALARTNKEKRREELIAWIKSRARF